MAVTINADNGVSSGSAGLKQTADSSGVLALQTNGTTAVTVDTSQNVGIGTASPSNTLQVTGTSYTTGKTYIGNNTNFTNVGNLGWSPAFIVEDTNGQGIAAVRNTADAYGGTINLVKSRGTLASPSAVTNGDRLGQIYFGGYDSVDYSNTGASIEAIANATWTSNSCPSDLVFSTTTSGSFVATERMRIDSSGRLLVGTTSAPGQTGGVVVANNELFVYNIPTTASGANCNISSGEGNRFYRSTSALKYKQDIRDLETIDIGKFRPVRYKSKCENDDQTKDHFGFIADEAADAGFEELVSRGVDGEVEGFQYDRMTVVLTAALQEMKAIIDAQASTITALTERITALENK